MPDVDTTLRMIAQWKYLIVTDLTSAFYQIPLAKDSIKYCGVATPFRGIRAYTRCAMGMPGSETALEELMCRVLGDCVQDGIAAKLADDLYCGGETPEDLLRNWQRILAALQKSNFTSPHRKQPFVLDPPPSSDGFGRKAVCQLVHTALQHSPLVNHQTLFVDYDHLLVLTKPSAGFSLSAPNF